MAPILKLVNEYPPVVSRAQLQALGGAPISPPETLRPDGLPATRATILAVLCDYWKVQRLLLFWHCFELLVHKNLMDPRALNAPWSTKVLSPVALAFRTKLYNFSKCQTDAQLVKKRHIGHCEDEYVVDINWFAIMLARGVHRRDIYRAIHALEDSGKLGRLNADADFAGRNSTFWLRDLFWEAGNLQDSAMPCHQVLVYEGEDAEVHSLPAWPRYSMGEMNQDNCGKAVMMQFWSAEVRYCQAMNTDPFSVKKLFEEGEQLYQSPAEIMGLSHVHWAKLAMRDFVYCPHGPVWTMNWSKFQPDSAYNSDEEDEVEDDAVDVKKEEGRINEEIEEEIKEEEKPVNDAALKIDKKNHATLDDWHWGMTSKVKSRPVNDTVSGKSSKYLISLEVDEELWGSTSEDSSKQAIPQHTPSTSSSEKDSFVTCLEYQSKGSSDRTLDGLPNQRPVSEPCISKRRRDAQVSQHQSKPSSDSILAGLSTQLSLLKIGVPKPRKRSRWHDFFEGLP